MNPLFRPVLGISLDKVLEKGEIRFPVYATPKYDGIRCLTSTLVPEPGHESVPVARSLKPIPNRHVFRSLAQVLPPGFDGELMTYTDGKMDPFQVVQSKIMSQLGTFEFKYHIFDWCLYAMNGYASENARMCDTYDSRVQRMLEWAKNVPAVNYLERVYLAVDYIEMVYPLQISNMKELEEYEEHCLKKGFEGICFRIPQAIYKFGRSTPREQYLVKVKRFQDAEALCIGVEELWRNQNAPEQNELGYQERSSHQAGMVPGGVLGALVCRTPDGTEFKVGSGFTATQRENLWLAYTMKVNSPVGQMVKYKFQPHGVKDCPRLPIFLGFRDPIDTDLVAHNKQQELL